MPDEDWALVLAMIKVIFARGWTHAPDCADASGVEYLQRLCEDISLDAVAKRCDVPVEPIEDLAHRFAHAKTAAAIARTGSAQGRNGSVTEWLTQVLNLITGRTDRPGGRIYFHPLLSGYKEEAFGQIGRAAVSKPDTVKHEWEFLRDLAPLSCVPRLNGTPVRLEPIAENRSQSPTTADVKRVAAP